jgi:inorganic triphosphatase YgiF
MNVERELKLTPASPELLARLAQISSLGPFAVNGRRREKQVNCFFDTRTGVLGAAHIGFRRRVVDRRPNATWTVKAEGESVRGISSRPEYEVQLSRLTPPADALAALRQAAERGAPSLADQLADALADGVQARPYLEMETDRWLLDLDALDQGWLAELALDTVSIIGRPRYEDFEIEVELKSGDRQALEEARTAIEALGDVRESVGSKLSRALDYIERSAPSSR